MSISRAGETVGTSMAKSNYREVEIKFEIDKPDLIRKRLKDLKAKFLGKAFEKAVIFDAPNGRLKKRGYLLRIRTGFKSVITFKRRIANKKFKEREEIELEIGDPEKMKIILRRLGFVRERSMERYREKWRLGAVEIVIDKVPMGVFLELEGPERSIRKAAGLLGLDFTGRITASYWELWDEFRRKKTIKNGNMIFRAK